MSINNQMYKKNKQAGFTLIEVLVAVLIFAIGMLGLAGLQLSAHQSSSFSQIRTSATLAATSLVERMRANRTAIQAGNYVFNAAVAGGSTIPAAVPACALAGCGGAANVAQNDLNEWLNQLNNSLPVLSGNALAANAMVVVCQDGTPTNGIPAALGAGIACDGDPNQWTIYIDWNDTRNLNSGNVNRYTFTFVP